MQRTVCEIISKLSAPLQKGSLPGDAQPRLSVPQSRLRASCTAGRRRAQLRIFREDCSLTHFFNSQKEGGFFLTLTKGIMGYTSGKKKTAQWSVTKAVRGPVPHTGESGSKVPQTQLRISCNQRTCFSHGWKQATCTPAGDGERPVGRSHSDQPAQPPRRRIGGNPTWTSHRSATCETPDTERASFT